MEKMKETYQTYNSHVNIEIEATDTTSGLTAAMQSASDWGMASRELKDYEKELLDTEIIAQDGVEVIVNENNPLESLTLEQLKDIFSGKIKNWEEL